MEAIQWLAARFRIQFQIMHIYDYIAIATQAVLATNILQLTYSLDIASYRLRKHKLLNFLASYVL